MDFDEQRTNQELKIQKALHQAAKQVNESKREQLILKYTQYITNIENGAS